MSAAAQIREIDIVAEFRDAMARRGIIPPAHIIADGKFHRCDTAARNGKGDATYLLHLDGTVPAGGFENHQDGIEWENWRADIGRQLTVAEREELRAKAEADRQQREADLSRRLAETAQTAERIWNESAPCTGHPYLTKKRLALAMALASPNAAILCCR
jgi:putative DNA primase/helicase